MRRTGRAGEVALAGLALVLAASGRAESPAIKPNIVVILADDLGYAEVGAYGQTKIRTPRIDRLAKEGVRFTDHYAGSPVCAPSRGVLLTGLHTGHAYIRDNDEMEFRGDVWHDPALEGQRPLPADTVTVASVLKRAGYVTAAIGKWGLGGPGSTGEPRRLGFDRFFGFLCQRLAHNHFPAVLWRDETRVPLDNPGIDPHEKLPAGLDPMNAAPYSRYGGRQYALDLMGEEARAFVKANRDRPFFLYFAPTVPHAALQAPDDSLADYESAFPETPYPGNKGYLPHRKPRAAYAAMVSRLDREVGRLADLIDELGLGPRTLILFTSDNGPTFNGGTDSAFFESAGPLRGLKTQLYEGGIRVPFIARWTGRVPANRVSARVSAFEDLMPTFADLAGARVNAPMDGVSLARVLTGDETKAPARPYLYWEFESKQAVRLRNWKGLRDANTGAFELYDLATDIGETRDVAAARPDIVRRIETIMRRARTESALFPLRNAPVR